MQNLTQSKNKVRTQAYVLLGITALWYVVCIIGLLTSTEFARDYFWSLPVKILPLFNVVAAEMLLRKAGPVHPRLVRWTLLAAVSMWFLFPAVLIVNGLAGMLSR